MTVSIPVIASFNPFKSPTIGIKSKATEIISCSISLLSSSSKESGIRKKNKYNIKALLILYILFFY